MTLPLAGRAAKARIEAFLARDPQPELARMHIVRGLADLDGKRAPDFVDAYIRFGPRRRRVNYYYLTVT